MNVLIATDGSMDVPAAAAAARRLAGDEGRVVILTVVEIPRRVLEGLRAVYTAPPPVREMGENPALVTPAEPPVMNPEWPGDDAIIARYVHNQVTQRTAELAEALAAEGVDAQVVGREGEDPTSEILEAIDEFGVEVVCLGSHGRNRLDGLLGSVGNKVARRAPCSVLLIKPS